MAYHEVRVDKKRKHNHVARGPVVKELSEKTVLNNKQEMDLVKLILMMENRLFGLTIIIIVIIEHLYSAPLEALSALAYDVKYRYEQIFSVSSQD